MTPIPAHEISASRRTFMPGAAGASSMPCVLATAMAARSITAIRTQFNIHMDAAAPHGPARGLPIWPTCYTGVITEVVKDFIHDFPDIQPTVGSMPVLYPASRLQDRRVTAASAAPRVTLKDFFGSTTRQLFRGRHANKQNE